MAVERNDHIYAGVRYLVVIPVGTIEPVIIGITQPDTRFQATGDMVNVGTAGSTQLIGTATTCCDGPVGGHIYDIAQDITC